MRTTQSILIAAGLVTVMATSAAISQTALVRDDLSEQDFQRVKSVTALTDDFSKPEKFETRQGGAATSFKKINRNAFSNPSQNLAFSQLQQFLLGNALFRKMWVSSPSSTHASDGLGPLFNARSCQSCHLKDGRGHPPEGASEATSMLIRLARPAANDNEQQALNDLKVMSWPDPVYGGQLQDGAVAELQPEGKIAISYTEQSIELNGGEVVKLRMPEYSIGALGYGPMHDGVTLSPRIAPPMIGLGLVEAIHPSDILNQADEGDQDGDGISGKASLVLDPDSGEKLLGRFGWKASKPSLKAQSAGAFSGDIGISTSLHPSAYGDCTTAQKTCREMPNGVQKRLGDEEAPDQVLDLVVFYSSNLAVPARRDVDDKTVLAGKELFYNIGCASCHTPKYVTRRDADIKELAFQLIWPYSDFLLHDMGEGLADNQPVGLASGSEWRTPPLWGIGLTETVNGHTFFLHDGRARNLTEAIMWHGGEAENAKQAFRQLEQQDRRALITFLESL